MLGSVVSSIKYKSRNDGKAKIIKITAGRTVQIISINCPSKRNRLI
jgi:hypothetical protein